jgi:hypothetical protein
LFTRLQDAEAALRSAGVYDTLNFSSTGVAGIFALYANPKAPLGEVFLNEFVSVRGQVHIFMTEIFETLEIGLLHWHSDFRVS